MNQHHLRRTSDWLSGNQASYKFTNTLIFNSGRETAQLQSSIIFTGFLDEDPSAPKLRFCDRPLGKVVSREKQELKINLVNIKDINNFTVHVSPAKNNTENSHAFCRVLDEKCWLNIVLIDDNLFQMVANKLKEIDYNVDVSISFNIDNIWQDEFKSRILFCQEEYEVNLFEFNFNNTVGDRKADVLNISDGLNNVNHQLENLSAEQTELQVFTKDIADEIKNISNTLGDMKFHADSTSDSLSSINRNTSELANISDEIIRTGNGSRGIRLLLFLNLLALLAILLSNL